MEKQMTMPNLCPGSEIKPNMTPGGNFLSLW
jgi:hypothetical protein